MTQRMSVTAVSLTLCLVASPAAALVHVPTSHVWTPVSGVVGSHHTVESQSTAAVRGAIFYEEADDPVYIMVTMAPLPGESAGGTWTYLRRATAAGAWGSETMVFFDRPNCRAWARRVDCPVDSFATAMRAYYISSRKGYAGLALRCTRVGP
jgi:hypothetical protein